MQVDIRTIIKQMMTLYNVDVTEIEFPYDQLVDTDYFRLRRDFNLGVDDIFKNSKTFFKGLHLHHMTIIEDILGICHLVFLLPDTLNCMMIGPYRAEELDKKVAERLHLTANQTKELKEVLMMVPVVSDNVMDLTLIPVISTIFDKEKIEIHHFYEELPKIFLPDQELFYTKEMGVEEKMQHLQERYLEENEVLSAVSKGDATKAFEHLWKMGSKDVVQRFATSLRSQKNSLIIFNSLLRKAIERSGVHPYYIDEISTRFSNMIEMVMDEQEYFMMMKMLITEYSDYVLKYGGNHYSPLVQKIVNVVNAEISRPISLNDIANKTNMNASYLSSLFKRETGMTLTNFINQQKMRHACEYLKGTQLSIAQVSERVGIEDVNYFSRVFKKQLGVSPSEYRKQ